MLAVVSDIKEKLTIGSQKERGARDPMHDVSGAGRDKVSSHEPGDKILVSYRSLRLKQGQAAFKDPTENTENRWQQRWGRKNF